METALVSTRVANRVREVSHWAFAGCADSVHDGDMSKHTFTLRPVEHGGVVTITITDGDATRSMRWAEVRDGLAAHYRNGTPAPFGVSFMGAVIGEPAYADVIGYEQVEEG